MLQKYLVGVVIRFFFLLIGVSQTILLSRHSKANEIDFPALGKAVEMQFGETKIDFSFKDQHTLSIVCNEGMFKGIKETVYYTAIKIRPFVYLVYWDEPVSKLNVVHIEDFEQGIVYTNVSYPNAPSVHLKGVLKIVGNAE